MGNVRVHASSRTFSRCRSTLQPHKTLLGYEQARQKSSAEVQSFYPAVILALANISGRITQATSDFFSDIQSHYVVWCRMGSRLLDLNQQNTERDRNARQMLFPGCSTRFIHLLPKTTFLRQLLMSFWGCWATYVLIFCTALCVVQIMSSNQQ